jgi:signal transduction histidine kinase
LQIINDLLDIAKIEAGQQSINPEKCNLNFLFSELNLYFTENQKYANKKLVNLTMDISSIPEELVCITDKVKLKQIFINLIDNAFKFTEQGTIKVGGKYDNNNHIIFYVSDTGIGIPADRFNEIFERFRQLENKTTLNHGGTGLGLSIVKGLVKLLGGKLWLESQPNIGSTFYFTISNNLSDAGDSEETPVLHQSHTP